ncbi:MAG: GldG family protein [Candidatus Hydrogenedentota bacterium]
MRRYQWIISIILVLGIIILINILGGEYFFRIDLTENKEYTLSSSFKKIITSTKDRVIIKAYFTEDLPFYFAGIKQRVRDFLEEVRILSKGNITYTFIDPSKNTEYQSQANSSGVPEVAVNYIDRDKAEIKKVYFGLCMHYEDRREAIPVIRDVEGIEYEFAISLTRLLQTEKPKVSFLTGVKQEDIEYEDIQGLVEELSKTYTINWTSPESKIDKKVKTLVVIKNKDITDKTLFNIDQFIMEGGNVIFCVSGMDGPPQNIFASRTENKLQGLLEYYGIKVNNNYIVDKSCVPVSFYAGYFSVTVTYPFYIKIIPTFNDKAWGFNKSVASVSGLESLILPWVSSVTTSDTELLTDVLVYSTPYADAMAGFVNLNYQQDFNLELKEDTYALGLICRGRVSSYFKDKENIYNIPVDDYKNKKDCSETTNIVVIGTEHFILDRIIKMYNENLYFINNIIDQLTLGCDLISIRSKQIVNRPIKELEEKEKNIIKYSNMIGVPLLIVVAGIMRYILRKIRVRKSKI